jgi:STE24 endopeptidase
MNPWLLCILAILLIQFLLDVSISILNLKALAPELPREFEEDMSREDYLKSLDYTKTTTIFSLIEESWTTGITLAFLLMGGFNLIDIIARSMGFSMIPTGLFYTGILLLLSWLLGLPFAVYSTFVIEARFGLNTTTSKTFILDQIKTILLSAAIGGPVLALIFWFFEKSGPVAWLYCWIGIVLISIVLQYLAPVLIMPLFNKFTPLAEGSLKEAITIYAQKQAFKMKGVFTMDGSKRSTKLNAFFTGFGKFRKIVFYDTLMAKLSESEILAVLAHEMGHYKLHHIFKMIVASILHTGVLFYLLSLTINNQGIFAAFGMQHLSIYASLVFFGFLFSPINLLVSIIFNFFSRRHEYDADRYAAMTTGDAENLISSLKKLSRLNLSNLTPHPLHVFLHYSHPPVLARINALRKNAFQSEP